VLQVASIIDKYYNSNCDIWGEPQRYKEISFYPLMIHEREQYEEFYILFTFNKDQIRDKNIAKMSYLKFLICILPYVYKCDIKSLLIKFLGHITRCDKIEITDNISDDDKQAISDFMEMMSDKKTSDIDFHYEFYTPEQLRKLRFFITINGLKFNESDFEVIREIILKQYDLDLDYIRSFDETLEENLKILRKSNDITFEEQVFSLSAVMKLPIYEIKNQFTIYQFNKTIERLHLVEDYESFKGLESAGFIKLKKGEIAHWLSHVPKRGRYDDLLVRKETFIKESDIFKASLSK
jgi:hypothetical protein